MATKKKKNTVPKQIKDGKGLLKQVFQEGLATIADDYISRLMSACRRAQPAQKINAIRGLDLVGVQSYKSEVIDALGTVAFAAITQARKEVPKAKDVKLSDAGAILFSDYDRLPPRLAKQIKNRTDILVGKQIGDLQATINFAYGNAEDETDSDDSVESTIRDSALGWLDGTALESGSSLNSAQVISDARNAFFFDDDTLQEIDAFEFVNGDPVTEICQDLAGTIFAKDDPGADEYFPPLHWNCKSSIQPILLGDLGDRDTEALKPSKASLDDEVEFSEHRKCGCSSD